MKLTRRDFAVASVAALVTAAAFVVHGQTAVLHSAAFDAVAVAVEPTPAGSVQHFFSAPTATLENLEVHVTTLNPGQSPHPPHRHPNEELILIRQGEVETLSQGTWKRVGVGSVIFNASNQQHGLRNIGKQPAQYFVVNFKTAATPSQ